MPSWELFEQQDQAYRDSVLPPDVTARVSVEAGSVIGWDRYVGMSGAGIGMRHLRRVGPDQGSDDEIRLHPGESARRSEATTRTDPGEDGMSPQKQLELLAAIRLGWIISITP